MTEELNIAKSRLVPLGSPEAYVDALKTRTVAAVVDELPYVSAFLSKYCGFQMAGQEFTKSGWGFVSINPCTNLFTFTYRFVEMICVVIV